MFKQIAVGVVAAITACFVTVTFPAAAQAEVSAGCLAHLAEIPADQKTTAAGDRRYHLARGEESPCSAQDVEQVDRSTQQSSSSTSSGKSYGEGKSRYCKKRWFC